MTTSGEGDFDPSVVAYDRELVPWLFEHWGEPMADLVEPEPSSTVVDLACGTGLIVHHLLRRLGDSGTIIGVDIDSAALTYAAAAIKDRQVSWHKTDAARLPFETSSVDRVSCHQGLQFFPDRLAVLAEVGRVLRPDGRLAAATWGRLSDNPWPAALSAAVGQLIDKDAGEAMSAVCDLGDPAELAELLTDAGFDNVRVEERSHMVTHSDVRAAARSQLAALPSGSAVGELSHQQQKELVDLMCQLLADHVDENGGLNVRSTSNFAGASSPARTS